MTNTAKTWPFPSNETRPTEAQTRANDLQSQENNDEQGSDERIEFTPGQGENAPGFVKPEAE